VNALIKTYVIPPCAGFLVGLALGAYLEGRTPAAAASAVKADKQLVETTRELGAEHIEAAKTKAITKRAAAARAVQDEVALETGGDADLASWFNERTGGD
jgi:hypothetical protein